MILTDRQLDRAAGALAGHHIGAGHPGVAMSQVLSDTLIAGCGLDTDPIAAAFVTWWDTQRPHLDVQTTAVLRWVSATHEPVTSTLMYSKSALYAHQRPLHAASNTALVSSLPLSCAYVGDRDDATDMAEAVALLTHAHPDSVHASILFVEAVRCAIETGTLDIRAGMGMLPHAVQRTWENDLRKAERCLPRDYALSDGNARCALLSAWCCIYRYGSNGIYEATSSAGDTRGVGALTGALTGSMVGYNELSKGNTLDPDFDAENVAVALCGQLTATTERTA